MGIITALKKRYKHLYLRDVLDFLGLDSEEKIRRGEKGRILSRGAAGVAHGRPAHLLDASIYVEEAFQGISKIAIKNCFKKAKIMLSRRL